MHHLHRPQASFRFPEGEETLRPPRSDLRSPGIISKVLWQFLRPHQKNRFLVLFDPSVDPTATGIRWHSNQAMLSLLQIKIF